MTDIVERLRERVGARTTWMETPYTDLFRAAADEIERLRNALTVARTAFLSGDRTRTDTLEEAAKLVEAQPIRHADKITLAAAIRARCEN